MYCYNHLIRSDELCHHGILGMKWGVRRYQNKDGTYTEAGKKRLEYEKKANGAKKKENRMTDEAVEDVNRWVREDYKNTKQVVDETNSLVKQASAIEEATRKKKIFDLSNMTDNELRNRINRERLEQEYKNLFSEDNVSKGRKRVRNILSNTQIVLTAASTSLGIALAIKNLMK